MSFSLSGMVDNFIRLYINGTKSDIDQVVDIEAAIGEDLFVSKDGYLMTIIKINGRNIESDNYHRYCNEFDPFVKRIRQGLSDGVHSLHVTYLKQTSNEKQLVKNSVSNSLERAKKIGLNAAEVIFNNQIENIASQIIDESVYLAVWTNTSFLRPRQIAVEKAEIEAARKLMPIAEDAHGLLDTYSQMKVKHVNYVESVLVGLRSSGVSAQSLSRDKAMLSMSGVINSFLGDDFQFIFPDKQTYPKVKEYAGGANNDCSHMLWDSLSSQIFREDDIEIDLIEGVTKVGDKYYTTFEVKNPPRDLVLFNSLGDSIRKDVPVLFSFNISSASSFTFFWKKMLSTLPYPESNKRIKKSIHAVSLLKELGEPDVEYKMSVSTWSTSPNMLLDNKDYLKEVVSAWGNSIVRNYRGCPFDALASSIQGVNSKTFGASVYAPLSAVVPQLPFARRMTFWKNSAMNLVANGDVLFPYSPQSSAQKYWNIGVCATMGSGKSVFLQNLAFAHMFGETIDGELPYVGYLDNGFSAQTFIETLRASLPKEKSHLFKHITYENTKKFAYNIFGTQLGCRYPDQTQLNQIISTLVAIVTPAGAKSIDDSFTALLRSIISETYDALVDREKPKMYKEGRSPKLAASLKKIGYNPDGKSYWQITDDMFKRNKLVLAEYAQRFAVPTIKDVLLQLTISDTVNNRYKKIVLDSNETLVDYVRRMLQESLEKYPVFGGVTELDVGLSRVIVLDLEKVSKTGTDELDKDSSVFYSLGRFIVSNNMFLSNELLNISPEIYKSYHEKRIAKIKSIPKMLVYDEYHRLKSKSVIDQIKREMREGRKWSLINVFASQLLDDFDKNTQELLSSMFLMSNDAGSFEQIQKTFSLDGDTMAFVKSELTGPQGARGTPILAMFKFKKGTLTQRLRFVLYPYMYWLTTSDSIDNELKNTLLSKVDLSTAIELLSKKYKFGCRENYEHISSHHPNHEIRESPIEYMCNDLLSQNQVH